MLWLNFCGVIYIQSCRVVRRIYSPLMTRKSKGYSDRIDLIDGQHRRILHRNFTDLVPVSECSTPTFTSSASAREPCAPAAQIRAASAPAVDKTLALLFILTSQLKTTLTIDWPGPPKLRRLTPFPKT
jgi:hypothetical protein